MTVLVPMHRWLTGLALAAAFSANAWALGLQAAVGQVVLGQPVRLTIALIGAEQTRLDPACFRLQAPAAATDAEYVLRDGRLHLETAQGQPRLIVTSQQAWPHPVLEFRVLARCDGVEVARDYLLLSVLPATASETVQRETKSAAADLVLPVRRPQVSTTNETLQLSRDTTLNVLARLRYPDNREARDTYRRLMAEANPDLLAERGPVGTVPLATGTRLNIPPGLPPPVQLTESTVTQPAAPRRQPVTAPALADDTSGATLTLKVNGNLNALARLRHPTDRDARDDFRRLMSEANPELFAGQGPVGAVPLSAGTVLKLPPGLPERQGEAPAMMAKPKNVTAGGTASPQTDRLVISSSTGVGAKGLSPGELAATLDRMERLSEEQGLLYLGTSENLKNLEHAFTAVAQKLLAIEPRLQQAEAERAAAEAEQLKLLAQLEQERSKFGLVEILLLILSCGGIGAGLIYYNDRMQTSRLRRAAMDVPDAVPLAVPAAPFAATPIVAVAPQSATSSGWRRTTSPAPVVNAPPPTPEVPVADETHWGEVARVEPLFAESPPAAPASTSIEPISLPQISLPPEKEPPPPIEFSLYDPADIELEPPEATSAAKLVEPKPPNISATSEHDLALELAELMSSLGLTQGAAQTLVEHINANPNESVQHWLKLLDLFHKSNTEGYLSEPVEELRSKFNVVFNERADKATGNHGSGMNSLLDYSHIVPKLVLLWKNNAECDSFLVDLLVDTRSGTRKGFPRAVVDEINLLRSLLNEAEPGA